MSTPIDPAYFACNNLAGEICLELIGRVDDVLIAHDGSDHALAFIAKLWERYSFGGW